MPAPWPSPGVPGEGINAGEGRVGEIRLEIEYEAGGDAPVEVAAGLFVYGENVSNAEAGV